MKNCREDLDSISVPTGIILSAFHGRVYTTPREFTNFVLYWAGSDVYDPPGRSDDRVRQRLFPPLPASFALSLPWSIAAHSAALAQDGSR